LTALYREVESRLDRLPGVTGSGLALYNPLTWNWSEGVFVAGHAPTDEGASYDRVRANYQVLISRGTVTPSCRVLQSAAGWYAVVQVPSLMSEEDLVISLLTRDGVLAHPGFFFDFSAESFLIVSLLVEPAAFADGIDRIFRYFDCSTGAA
jgi:aspartate/methionine/tyrosine aminotransferase